MVQSSSVVSGGTDMGGIIHGNVSIPGTEQEHLRYRDRSLYPGASWAEAILTAHREYILVSKYITTCFSAPFLCHGLLAAKLPTQVLLVFAQRHHFHLWCRDLRHRHLCLLEGKWDRSSVT